MAIKRSVATKLKIRCPCCKKLRGGIEPPHDQGGEDHPRRKPWVKTPFGKACGWCAEKYSKEGRG